MKKYIKDDLEISYEPVFGDCFSVLENSHN